MYLTLTASLSLSDVDSLTNDCLFAAMTPKPMMKNEPQLHYRTPCTYPSVQVHPEREATVTRLRLERDDASGHSRLWHFHVGKATSLDKAFSASTLLGLRDKGLGV